MALLDQMVSPHWPYLPKRKDSYVSQEEKEGIEGVWKTIPEDPLNYHFCYAILDGDAGGRPPKVVLTGGHTESENKYFNWRDKSCLNIIAKSNNKVCFKLEYMEYFHWSFGSRWSDLNETVLTGEMCLPYSKARLIKLALKFCLNLNNRRPCNIQWSECWSRQNGKVMDIFSSGE